MAWIITLSLYPTRTAINNDVRWLKDNLKIWTKHFSYLILWSIFIGLTCGLVCGSKLWIISTYSQKHIIREWISVYPIGKYGVVRPFLKRSLDDFRRESVGWTKVSSTYLTRYKTTTLFMTFSTNYQWLSVKGPFIYYVIMFLGFSDPPPLPCHQK